MDTKDIIVFVPGLCQGLSRVCISYPFDYIRLHVQRGIYPSMRAYIRQNGIRNVFNGIKYPITIVPIDRAIAFKYYEDLNKHFNPFAAAAITSFWSSIYGVPLQSINTNYILTNSNQPYFQFIRGLIRQYQYTFIYRSYMIEYSRLFAGNTLYLGLYGSIRDRLPQGIMYHMANGVATSMILWTILYPVDTIRVDQQSNPAKLGLWKTICNRYRGQYIQSANNIIPGIRHFYKGIGLVYARTIPSAAVGMAVYEYIRKLVQ